MFAYFDPFRELTFYSVVIRLALAMVCGGLIGLERTYKRRPVGFRTHILICVGAALTTLTSEYLAVCMHYYLDITRMGAGVVAGVGFIGAGTIITTTRNRVQGLTTAAGFWVAAIIGLAFGAGYFEAGVLTTVLVIAVEFLFVRLEYWFMRRDPEVNLFVEYMGKHSLEEVLNCLQKNSIRVRDMEISQVFEHNTSCAVISFRIRNREELYALRNEMYELDGIVAVEDL